MKFKLLLLINIALSYQYCFAQTGLQSDTMYIRCTQTLDFAAEQATRLTNSLSGTQLPNCLTSTGGLYLVSASDWTSGFFPGELWYLSNYKNDLNMQINAKKFTQLLQNQQYTTTTHDLGFMMFCSYGNGLQFANVSGYRDVLIQSAKSLETRFNTKVGCIRSWNSTAWSYPVIIDNMMNLEMLCWATRATGDSTYYKNAIIHALTTMKNHFRPDYSSYHLVDYNLTTGAVIGKQTVQGYSNESSWARGQAWGLYGFTMMYRETKIEQFLVQALHIADYMLRNLPSDYIPYWDYNDPTIPNTPRDASAASISASALLQLYGFSNNVVYLRAAEKILWNLSSPTYMNTANQNMNFLLKHSTGSKPSNSQVDVPIIFADYYFVEALCRYVSLKKTISNVSEINIIPKSITVFPNPIQRSLTIKATESFDRIEITDTNGKVLLFDSFSRTNQVTVKEPKNLMSGICFLKVYSKIKLVGVEKIIK